MMPLNEIGPEPLESWLNCMAAPQMPDALMRCGFEEVGSGCFKSVYAHPACDFVVKVVWDKYGSHEPENYAAASSRVRKLLLPILAHGEGWQTQKRIKPGLHGECARWGCDGDDLPGLDDTSGKNHTHDEAGNVLIFDYGQPIAEWYTGWRK